MEPAGPFIPSAAAVPGAPLPTSADKRIKTLGTTALVLAILDLVWCLYKIGSAAISVPMMAFQRKMVPPASPGTPAGFEQLFEDMQENMVTLAAWDAARQVLFAIASAFLVYIALRLLRSDASALSLAQTWTWGAFAVIVVSIGIQAAVIYPMQMDYLERMQEFIASSGPMPSGFGSTIEAFSLVSIIVTLVGGTIVMAVWPIVLRIWADRLQDKVAG